MRTVVLVALCALLVACAASQPTTRGDASAVATTAQVRDGSSYDRAIVIQASNEFDGIAQEYRWIEKHYPGYKRGSQALAGDKGRAFDILTFTDAKGDSHTLYFDITSFFGKL